MDRAGGTAVLVSATCTTGWDDWVHGEFWLCPNGLLRFSTGIGVTLARAVRRGPATYAVDLADRPERTFSDEEIEHLLAIDRRNKWIPWSDVAFAKLKWGVTTTTLYLALWSLRHEKLLWIRTYDGADDVLIEAMARELPNRCSATTGFLG